MKSLIKIYSKFHLCNFNFENKISNLIFFYKKVKID